jgi:hypothetical protein
MRDVTGRKFYKRFERLAFELLSTVDEGDLLLGNEPAPGQHAFVPVMVFAPAQADSQQPKPDAPNAQPLSIGAVVVDILTEAAKSGGRHANVPLQTILERVHAKGRTEVSLKTLGGVISQYTAKGTIRRISRATYALPRATVPTTATANGASTAA